MAPRAHEIIAVADPPQAKKVEQTAVRKHADPEVGVNRTDGVKTGEPADFETAVDATGSGLFSYAILVTAGLIFASCGLQNGIHAYILPAAKCDFSLSSAQIGMLNAFFLFGGIASSYVWGILADALGRRPIIVFALVADAACTVISTLSPNYAVFAALRFLSGALIGGPASLAFLYVGEFIPARLRTSYSLVVGGFWTVSWLILPGLAWLVLPQPWEVSVLGVPFNSWRVMLSLVAAPTLLCALLTFRFPETPKYLISQGRLKEAMVVLKSMYATNTGRDPDEFPVRCLALPAQGTIDVVEVDAAPELDLKSVVAVARRMLGETLTLFKAPVVARTALVCFIVFANMFTYYGLSLWLPELFNRFEDHYSQHPDTPMSVCQLTTKRQDNATETEASCSAAEAVNETVFRQTLIINSVCLVANILSAVLATRVGRRALPFFLNVASGALAATIYFVDSTAGNLVVASLFQALIGTGNTAINGFMVDIFPPRVSALGVCSAILAGRVGAAVSNVVVGNLLDTSCEVPLFLMSATVIVGGIACIFVQPPWATVDMGRSLHAGRGMSCDSKTITKQQQKSPEEVNHGASVFPA